MSWIPLNKVLKQLKNRKFNWNADSRMKYLSIRIDTRDDHVLLLDREGKVLADNEEDLDELFEKLNKIGEESPSLYGRRERSKNQSGSI